MKSFVLLISSVLFFTSLLSQDYTEIPIDTVEHYNIMLIPGETYHFETFSGSVGQYEEVILGFLDQNDEPVEFVDIEIDDIFLAGIVPPNTFIWNIKFNLTLNENAPPPGTINGISMVSIFLNNSGDVIGGYIRTNMSFSLDGTDAVIFVPEKINQLKVYPNPASDLVTVEHPNGKGLGDLTVYDMAGKVILYESATLSKSVVNLYNVPSGQYFIKVQNQSGQEVYPIIKH